MNESSAGGIGIASVLTIVFVVLKLCNIIEWPWIWVLSPLWISVAIGVLVIIFFTVILGGIFKLFKK